MPNFVTLNEKMTIYIYLKVDNYNQSHKNFFKPLL